MLLASQVSSGSPDIGPPYLLDAFAAAFLGATQFGGRFNAWGTVIAVLLLGTGKTGLVLVGAEPWAQSMFSGVVLLAALALTNLERTLEARTWVRARRAPAAARRSGRHLSTTAQPRTGVPMITTADTRCSRLIDADEIRRVIYEYAFHLDMNHPDELASSSSRTARSSTGRTSAPRASTAYRGTLEGIGEFFEATSHHVSNIVVDFTERRRGERRARCCTRGTATAADRPDSHVWGQYHDVMVRIDGQWRFKRRELRAAGTQGLPRQAADPAGAGGSKPAACGEYRSIRIEHRGPITWMVLDRPDKANALSNGAAGRVLRRARRARRRGRRRDRHPR